jgi:PLP dependent protein
MTEPGRAPSTDASTDALSAAHAAVHARIAAACRRAGRSPDEVQLVAVSKTVPLARLRPAVAAGLRVLGENRVQEAAEKAPALPEVEWHLVGHLQRNKAARALELFDVVESLDSLPLAQRLDRLVAERLDAADGPMGPVAARLPVYLQVNVDADPAKEGFLPDGLHADLPAILGLPRLEVRGLMTVGRLVEDPEAARPTFVRLRELSAALRAGHEGLGSGLSMGMSDDLEIAVEEGSTLVRVGRALFGERETSL